jgi:hypothetical protein
MSDWWSPDAAQRLVALLWRHPEMLAELVAMAELEEGAGDWPTAPLHAAIAERMSAVWREWVTRSYPEACGICGALVIRWPDGVLMDWPDRVLHVCRLAPGDASGPGAVVTAVRQAENREVRLAPPRGESRPRTSRDERTSRQRSLPRTPEGTI